MRLINRLTATQGLHHPWMVNIRNIVSTPIYTPLTALSSDIRNERTITSTNRPETRKEVYIMMIFKTFNLKMFPPIVILSL